jgi:nickel/cobalt transporter (NicO) family protein
MPDIAALIQSGTTNLWLFIPTAILLGALHGLEPGHSKTMMAAFIIAVRGTVMQAILLGLAATVSHTAVVWAIALAGLHFGAAWSTEATEPYLQLVSAFLIIGIALWMLWRNWHDQNGEHHHHDQDGEVRLVDIGHDNRLALDIFEKDVPPRWRIERLSGPAIDAATLALETVRPDGSRQSFSFIDRDGLYESVEDIPEPHEFTANLRVAHGNHAHAHSIEFREHHHTHGGLDVGLDHDAGAHERAHAEDIRRRFANQRVTTGQIVVFGLTGGLIPCPASITILLLCLQLKQFTLGAMLVLCFSVGLALTMVTVGTAAAMSVHHVATRWEGFAVLARRAPYVSGVLIILVGLYTGYLGWSGLPPHLG